jgi:hypothetical protein
MDNSLTPIEDMIYAGFGRRFLQVFGIPILFTNATDKRAAYAQKFTQDPNLKLPFAFASYTGQSLTETRYSPQALLRRGLYGAATHDMVQTYRLRMIPVTTAFQILVLTEDLPTALEFSKRWLMATVEGSLKFTLTYGIADVDIHVELDRDVQIPQRTAGVDEPREYEIQTTLRLEGYTSKDLERAQAATEVVAEGRVGSAEDVATAIAGGPNKTTQFFQFNRPWDNT